MGVRGLAPGKICQATPFRTPATIIGVNFSPDLDFSQIPIFDNWGGGGDHTLDLEGLFILPRK